MLELSLLGLHAVRGADGREAESLPAQPKRFALLAYLAVAGGDGYHRRDSLAAMFWPDLDQFAARRALRNTLYHLKEALGEGVIVVRGDDAVSIDAGRLTCDVRRLADAVAAGRYEEAVDLYRGELLAGVHFANAGDAFEDWLSRERQRVTALVRQALTSLMERDEAAGAWADAARWARRACLLAPDDEGLLRRAMALLEQVSDTGGALRLYETYVQRLATEFSASPSAETETLAARIRGGGPAPARRAPRSGAASVPAPGGGHGRTSMSEPPQETRAATPAASPLPAVMPGPRPPRARRVFTWAGALAAVLVLGALGARAAGIWRPRAPAARTRVLVTVFDNLTGDPRLQSLGRMAQDWLTQGVVRTHLVDVVDPRAVFVQGRSPGGAVNPIDLAHHTGATLVVSGSYDRAGDSLLLQATVMDAGTGRIVRGVGPIAAPAASPVAAIDALRSRVMTALASVVDVRATQDLGRTDELPAYDAYQSYVDGWDAFWHGDGKGAEALFLRAAHRDTAFTAAGIAAATAASNSLDCPLVDSLDRALGGGGRSLDRVDRLTLQIAGARCYGRNEEMLRLTLERADLEPGNAGAQMSAAAAALWANRPERALAVLGRVNPATDLAWNTDTTHFAWYGGVAEALHLLGRHREELEIADRLPRGTPLSHAWLRANALAALSRPTTVLALLDSAPAMPVETSSDIGLAPFTDGRPAYTFTPGWVANWVSRELAVHGDTVAARQAAMRAVAWYRSRPAAEQSTPEERLVASWSLEMTGAFPEAERLARRLVAEDSSNVDYRGELAGLAAERGDTALADSVDRWLAAQPVARVSWTASIYRARVAALLGRRDAAMARLRDAFDEGIWPRWLHQEPAFNILRDRSDFIALTQPRG